MHKTALYRAFDEHDNLLYIGISANPFIRTMRQHRRRAAWIEQCVHFSLDWFDTRKDAERAESAAIRAERPRYNIAQTDRLPYRQKREPLEGYRWDIASKKFVLDTGLAP